MLQNLAKFSQCLVVSLDNALTVNYTVVDVFSWCITEILSKLSETWSEDCQQMGEDAVSILSNFVEIKRKKIDCSKLTP